MSMATIINVSYLHSTSRVNGDGDISLKIMPDQEQFSESFQFVQQFIRQMLSAAKTRTKFGQCYST